MEAVINCVPFISFIIPVYNTSEKYLVECIESVLAVRTCAYEILIVDDGSTSKETKETLERYKTVKPIRIITCTNSGVSVARNTGLQEAKGDYILFVDSDDTLQAETLDSIIPFIRERQTVGLFAFTHNDIDERGRVLFEGCNDNQYFRCPSIFDLYQMGAKKNASYIREAIWAKVYKRSDISGIFFDSSLKFGEDNLFVLEVCARNIEIVACAKAIYNYRRGDGSATNKYSPNIQEERLKTLYKLEAFYMRHGYEKQLVSFGKDVIFRTYMHLLLRLWLFHPDCPMCFKERRQKAIEILHGEPFGRMFEKIRVQDLNKKEKLVYLLLKYNFVYCAFCLFSLHKPVITR